MALQRLEEITPTASQVFCNRATVMSKFVLLAQKSQDFLVWQHWEEICLQGNDSGGVPDKLSGTIQNVQRMFLSDPNTEREYLSSGVEDGLSRYEYYNLNIGLQSCRF